MPIEIKEIIIKTKVEKEPYSADTNEAQLLQFEIMKNEILKSCKQMVEKMLKSKTKR